MVRNMETFGNFVKNIRLEKRISLREFCRQTGQDPSNWSKIERGILAPPRSEHMLKRIAEVLQIENNSEEYNYLFDVAAISFIPENLLSDKTIIDKLPIFFRTVRGEKPTQNELDELIKLIKEG